MTRRKYAAGIGAIACLLTSTAAFAADATRSSSALPAPSAQRALQAPTNGVRSATTLKKKSNALGEDGVIAVGILGAVAIGTAIYVAVEGDDEPDSAG